MNKNLPSEVGLYFAKEEGMNWWNWIMEISGNPPFLQVKGWKRNIDEVYKVENPEIFIWGPKLEFRENGDNG